MVGQESQREMDGSLARWRLAHHVRKLGAGDLVGRRLDIMLKAFDCNVKGSTFPPTTIYHVTAGKAKYEFWTSVTESYPDIKYTDIRVCRGSDHPSKKVFDEFL